MKASTSTMTAEEKLEQTRERNRVKQASLRQRRAARMAELEATNAKLAELAGTTPLPIPKKGVRTTQKRPAEDESPSPSPSQDKPPAHPVASGSGTSGGPPTPAPYPHWSAPRPDDRPSRSDEEVARLTGVVSRLVSRLKEYGAGEGEIGRLIAGREPSHSHGAGPSRSPLARLGTSGLSGSSYLQLTSPTSNERTSFQLPPLVEDEPHLSTERNGPGDSSVFPFAFLFNDTHPSSSAPNSPYNPSPPNGSSYPPSLLASVDNGPPLSDSPFPLPTLSLTLPPFGPPQKRNRATDDISPLSSKSSTSELLAGPVPSDPAVTLARLTEVAALAGSIRDGTSENPLNKAIPWAWKEVLFAIHAKYADEIDGQALRGTDQVSVSEELVVSAQLLVLQLLTATSSQKRLYDDERTLAPGDQVYLSSGRLDARLGLLPDPSARVTLGKASDEGRLNLTEHLARYISQATLYGDVWDWTGYRLPPAFHELYPLSLPAAPSTAGPTSLSPRPLPEGLRGASIREIVLGLDPPGSRASGPFVYATE